MKLTETTEKPFRDPRNGMIGTLSDFEDMYKEVLDNPETDFQKDEFDAWASEYIDEVTAL